MGFNISSGNIEPNVLYIVIGSQYVTYNGTIYTTGQTFTGVSGVSIYTLSGGLGSAEVDEVTQFFGSSIEFDTNQADNPIFPESTIFQGSSIEFDLNKAEQLVDEVTIIQGFSIELENYPYYAFEIIETRIR